MKLRNKKTGEIPDKIETIAYIQWSKKIMMVYINSDGVRTMKHYDSLNDFNEEWEDYEEPKDNNYWYIDDLGRIQFSTEVLDEVEGHPNNWLSRKLFGNYFETKEEAKKALEKLKAWKRLKDNGFRFERWLLGGEYGNTITFSDYIECDDKTRADLDLLFGGEE